MNQETCGQFLKRKRFEQGNPWVTVIARKIGERADVLHGWENDRTIPPEAKYKKILKGYKAGKEELRASIEFSKKVRAEEIAMRAGAMKKNDRKRSGPKTVEDIFHSGAVRLADVTKFRPTF